MKDGLKIPFESIFPDSNFDERRRFEDIDTSGSQLTEGDCGPDGLPIGNVDVMVCWRCMDEIEKSREIRQELQDFDSQLCRKAIKV